ncbi:MAG: hypothetical protein ABSD82_03800 [Solirubrobacteraceae bacterium]|jgi:hypothetical protein
MSEPSPRQTATRRAVSARDAGLRRISSVTRWLAIGVVGLSGALALVAANAFHGHTVSNASAATPAAGAPVTPSSGGLSPAAVTPTVTPSAPVVVSGGS